MITTNKLMSIFITSLATISVLPFSLSCCGGGGGGCESTKLS